MTEPNGPTVYLDPLVNEIYQQARREALRPLPGCVCNWRGDTLVLRPECPAHQQEGTP